MAIKKGTKRDDSLLGTSGDDILYGFAGNDYLKGLNGDDTLFGGDGNDTLDGVLGDDELLGEAGNDLLLPGKGGADAINGGAGTDTVSYANFQTTLGVTITSSEVGADDAAGDTYQSIENFIGSKASDFIVLGFYAGAVTEFIYGGAGDDVINGRGHVMRGDAGNDSLYCEQNRTATDTVWLQLDKGQDFISNFTDGQDRFRVSGKEFGIGALLNSNELFNRAADSNPTGSKAQFIFRQDNDQLFFDPDGIGAEVAVLMLDFDATSPIGSLQFADFEIV